MLKVIRDSAHKERDPISIAGPEFSETKTEISFKETPVRTTQALGYLIVIEFIRKIDWTSQKENIFQGSTLQITGDLNGIEFQQTLLFGLRRP